MLHRLASIMLYTATIVHFACGTPHADRIATSDSLLRTTAGEVVEQLPSCVWYIHHDTKDRYWLGTDTAGVYCIDNRTIIRYTTKDGLPDNRIGGIQEDQRGNILIETNAGLSIWNGQSFRTLHPEWPTDGMEGWTFNTNDLWFRGKQGPLRYDGERVYQLALPSNYHEKSPSKQHYPEHLSPYMLYTIYKDRNGCVWFGTADLGVCRFDGQRLAWLYEDSLTYTPTGGSFGIRSILQDASGKYWICNTRQQFEITGIRDTLETPVLTYTTSPGIMAAHLPEKLYIMSMLYDHQGTLWMATYDDGLWCYDGKRMEQIPLPQGTTLFTLYADRNGRLLLGTHQKGVLEVRDKKVVSFPTN